MLRQEEHAYKFFLIRRLLKYKQLRDEKCYACAAPYSNKRSENVFFQKNKQHLRKIKDDVKRKSSWTLVKSDESWLEEI